MAELSPEGNDLVVQPQPGRESEAVHGDIRVPMSSVREVEVVDDAGARRQCVHQVCRASWPGLSSSGRSTHRAPRSSPLSTTTQHEG